MEVTYSRAADAAYVYLDDECPPVAKTVALAPIETGGAMVNLDFDADGRLIGIEVLSANFLPTSLLARARSI